MLRTAIPGAELSVSIRAPREGSDAVDAIFCDSDDMFQSAPPVRGAILDCRFVSVIYLVSIRAPREGSDVWLEQ